MRKYSFEKLEVWQLSRQLSKEIYIITSEFPENEKYGLINQLRRAAISISNNLVEGTARTTVTEKKRYIEIGYGSLLEVLNMLILSKDLDLINMDTLNRYRTKIEELSNKLNALKNNIR